ncbi:hypothetical protein PG2022B_1596 [Bifidobacterium animalis subsp. animalis]|nr:hypothetical protein PG2022B_1596 [Bifidobacterium animalis subsp. animalis]
MGVHAESYEQKLEAIARTERWDEALIVGNMQDYQAMLETVRDRVDKVRRWMADSGEFDCKAQDGMYATATRIVRAINDAHGRNEEALTTMSRQIQRHNEGIAKANAVELPGGRLTASDAQRIITATQPLNIALPGLGTLTGVVGVAGVNMVSRLLSAKREEEAKTRYNEIIRSVLPTRFVPHPIPVVDMPKRPDPRSDSDMRGGGAGSTGMATVAGAAVVGGAAIAGGAALRSDGVGMSGAIGGVAGSSGAPRPVAGGGSSVRAGASAAGSTSAAGVANERRQVSGHVLPDRPVSPNTPDEVSPLQGWDANGTYRYDPATDSWVRTDGDGASVDSYSMRGVPDVAKTALGAGAIGLAASVGRGSGAASMASTAMSAGASSSAALGSMVGTGGIGGVGSFYANNPVHATITPVSSVKGMQGLAAGLRQQAAAGTASSVNGKSSPAMMSGAGAGAGGDSGKRKPRRLGYVAPTIEDDEEFEPTPLGNMAGRRRD